MNVGYFPTQTMRLTGITNSFRTEFCTKLTMSEKKNKMAAPTEKDADFETAISATGFGTFNLILLGISISSVFASQAETSSLSYVYPVAECDLKLTLEDRGLINAVIYAGMIGSCFLWGPLVDVFGRRKILIVSHILDSVFILMAAFAPNVSVLIAAKFLGGFIINGPSMALTPYLSELHATHYRSRVPLTIGTLYSFINIVIPLLAWAILPLNVKWSLPGGFEFHSWNLFLLVCSLPAFTSGLIFMLTPESPKYLMSKGNNEQALQIFQKVYKINTGRPRHEYPIKQLTDERQIYQKKHGLREAWEQISPLFTMTYAPKLVLTCLLMGLLMMCVNSLRLWLPEIFQVVNDYEGGATTSFCQILNTIQRSGDNGSGTCSMNFDNSSVYINSAIVGFIAVVGYLTAAFTVNKVGKKRMLIILGFVSGATVGAIYFAPNTAIAVTLLCIHLTCSCVCIDIVVTAVVDIFPTYLRASALSLTLMSGRLGSLFGNLTFPFLLQAGCAPPFFTIGSIVIFCAILSLFLPNTDNKALE